MYIYENQLFLYKIALKSVKQMNGILLFSEQKKTRNSSLLVCYLPAFSLIAACTRTNICGTKA